MYTGEPVGLWNYLAEINYCETQNMPLTLLVADEKECSLLDREW